MIGMSLEINDKDMEILYKLREKKKEDELEDEF